MRRLPVIVLLIAFMVLAWHPHALPQAFAHQDKLLHFACFAVLAMALRYSFAGLSWSEYAAFLLLSASVLELVQSFVPTRTASLTDLLASGFGIASGLWATRRWNDRSGDAADATPEAPDAT